MTGPKTYEEIRLRRENDALFEQLRTLKAHLVDRHPDHIRIAIPRGVSTRPEAKRCATYSLLAEELRDRANFDVVGALAERMHRQIEEHAKFGQPLDYTWHITVERDYRADSIR